MAVQKKHRPTDIRLHQKSRVLEVIFDNGAEFRLPCEFLRVHSPSAEVQGHGVGQETLQVGKERVNIKEIEPIGAYAVKLHFDDGHNTGLFSWEFLYRIGQNQEAMWQSYLQRLTDAGHQRIVAEGDA
ncbi:MAG: DUF971 domain-containing protein [Gammaproteobacteria bacterium]|nr:DUF971 domain-containing protein [Gammaproteobacteria bacterium]